MQSNGKILLGIGNGVMAGALWGFVFLAPQLLRAYSPAQLSAARYLIYGVFALVLLSPRWKIIVPRLGKREWFALAWLSLCGNILYYVLLSRAVQFGGGASTSLIVGLLPVTITFVGARDEGAVKLRSLALPMLFCCLGVFLIGYEAIHTSFHGTDNAAHRLIGLLCAFGALGSWAAYAVGNSRHLARLPEISAHDWSLLTGVVTGAFAMVLAIFVFRAQSVRHGTADWLCFWSVSGGVAIFASIIGNGFWNRASRLLPLTLTGQLLAFETLFALLYSFLWEHRTPTRLEMLAILSLLSGVVWCASLHRVPMAEPSSPTLGERHAD
jgi:drug/metabolite transporter (DMT)-like permease